MRKIAAVLFAALLFGGCSRSEPKISFGTLRLVRYGGPSGIQERYTFFVLAEDGDGMEDLADLYLYQDREGLFWHIPQAEWVRVEHEGKTWIGSRALATGAGEALPRGQFRAVLVDQGGGKSERTFTFDAPQAPRYPFPVFTVAEGRYSAVSRYPENFVIFYDAAGVVLGIKDLPDPEGPVSLLSPPQGAMGAALWAEDSGNLSSALTEIALLAQR